MVTQDFSHMPLPISSKVTTPQGAHGRLLLQVYLGSNTSEFIIFDDGNCIVTKKFVNKHFSGWSNQEFTVKYKYSRMSVYMYMWNVHKKLQCSCSDVLTGDQWAHTELHFQACLRKI